MATTRIPKAQLDSTLLYSGGGLGTPTSGVLTNATGLPISTGLTGAGTGVLTALAAAVSGSGSIALTTSPTFTTPTLGAATATTINKVTITAPTTSATLTLVTGSSLITAGAFALTLTTTAATNVTFPTSGTLFSGAAGSIPAATLLAAVSGVTGTGNLVFATSPTFVTPALGTPASGIMTNVTGTAAGLTAGNATAVGGITISGTPSAGYIPVATSGTAATWQAPTGGGGGLAPTYNLPMTAGNVAFGQTAYYGYYTANVSKTIAGAEIYLPYVAASSVIEIGIYNASTLLLIASGTYTTSGTTAQYAQVSFSAAVTAGGHYIYAVLNRTLESTTQFAALYGTNSTVYTFQLTGKTALDSGATTLPTSGRNSTNVVPYVMFY